MSLKGSDAEKPHSLVLFFTRTKNGKNYDCYGYLSPQIWELNHENNPVLKQLKSDLCLSHIGHSCSPQRYPTAEGCEKGGAV